VDGQQVVIAEGTYGDGVSWLIWASRSSLSGGEPGEDELMSMIRITDPDGPMLHEGGAGGPALYPGTLMKVSTGGGGEGPYALLARVHPDIRRVELTTADGEIMNVPVYDSPDFQEVRFATLLVPRDLHLDSVTGFSDGAEELERFDLAFHQRFWHQRR
jgi:hypothetical protein